MVGDERSEMGIGGIRKTEIGRDGKVSLSNTRSRQGCDLSRGKSGRGGEAVAVVILRVDLNELVAEMAQFDADGSMGRLDGLFLAAEGASLDPLHAEAEGGGFAEDKGGELFGVSREGEDGQEVAGSTLFHDQRGNGRIEGTFGHQPVDGMGELFPGDVVQVGADLKNGIRGVFRNGGEVAQKSPEDVGAVGKVTDAETVAD